MKQAKQLLAILLVVAMALSCVSCGNNGTSAMVGIGGKPAVRDEATDEAVKNDDGNAPLNDVEIGKDSGINNAVSGDAQLPYADQATGNDTQLPAAQVSGQETAHAPKSAYNKGIVLVKVKDSFDKKDLGDLAYTSADALYEGSKWYAVKLTDTAKTEDAVTYLTGLGTFASVDYDYVMGVTAKETENPDYDKQTNLGLSNIPYGWTQNGKAPGGSSDVVVAVIDTGVDYNHLDLRNNIWINTAEIPDNGRDDDSNGYVDDIYGWDCVGNDKDPMDDNGHGTHVAGIIAAENNKVGGIGVAYNCKVMVLKAGNSSGYFNNSDIAEAIQYAYMNGASVINMSFGGSFISIAVEEALENAYNSCVLVAAAGNDGACNNLACPTCDIVKVSYPAALPYVIGVMSTDKNGSHVSSFSNYDHYPYDSIEYEVFAVGEGVGSTWPSNKYACLNGTSMAAPTVSGIAALLRSYYTDREVYSTKFIQSQIVNTGDLCLDGAHTVADVQDALTKLPKPAVNLYDYSIDDSVSISSKNNGNGVIDAGETVRLYISLHNRGGVASNVNVSIDTYRSEIGDETMTDPYFTFVNPTMQLSDIGTYSVRESSDKYFEIVVDANCPNDYLVNFNIRFTYTNGLDTDDKTVYEDDGKQKAQFNVSRGFLLPATITEDTVYEADKLYIVGQDVFISEGVTVTFEEGCEIQFYDDREYYNSPAIFVYGTLNICGTEDNMVRLCSSERYINYAYYIVNYGQVNIDYMKSTNLFVNSDSKDAVTRVSNSYLLAEKDDNGYFYAITDGGRMDNSFTASASRFRNFPGSYYTSWQTIYQGCYINYPLDNFVFSANTIENSFIVHPSGSNCDLKIANLRNCQLLTMFTKTGSNNDLVIANECTNNVFRAANESVGDLITCSFNNKTAMANNAFSPAYQKYASQVVADYYNVSGNPTIDVYGSCSDVSALYPHIVSIEIFNKDGEQITTIGKEEITVRVTFNRPMDTTKDTFLTFGTIEPYADYKITGSYVSDTVWEGTYTLKAQIENGQNFLKVEDACAAEDSTKTVFGEYQLHEFTIDTTAAMAMNLQAVATDGGVELTFAQDDYDTLLGYNIYRSEDKDGNYVKLNPAIVLPEENAFLDNNAEPGKTYWYTYTVVLSDFTESNPAGKVQATAKDTMAPSLYHTPVNQGYENNNLVISCTASDNIGIEKVTLYYRVVGADSWKALTMSKQNNKYSATIFGSDVTLAGLEYYIVAKDAYNAVNKGSAETPYAIVVKSADSLLGKGDVDGNGQVTTKDALMLMQCLSGDLLLADDAFKRADLNGDGILSAVEALRILQYINGKVTTLEM